MNDAYRLGPVRDARDREERIRRGDLAAAVDGVRATEQQVLVAAARVEAARAALSASRSAPVGRAISAAELGRAALFTARLRRDLDAAQDAHARAIASHRGRLGDAEQARDRLARARADREVIERHFERWREQTRKLADRRSE